jgi:hypothetical protein
MSALAVTIACVIVGFFALRRNGIPQLPLWEQNNFDYEGRSDLELSLSNLISTGINVGKQSQNLFLLPSFTSLILILSQPLWIAVSSAFHLRLIS